MSPPQFPNFICLFSLWLWANGEPLLWITNPRENSTVLGIGGDVCDISLEYTWFDQHLSIADTGLDGNMCGFIDGEPRGCLPLNSMPFCMTKVDSGVHHLRFTVVDVNGSQTTASSEVYFTYIDMPPCASQHGDGIVMCEWAMQQRAWLYSPYYTPGEELHSSLASPFSPTPPQPPQVARSWHSSLVRGVEAGVPKSNTWSYCQRCGYQSGKALIFDPEGTLAEDGATLQLSSPPYAMLFSGFRAGRVGVVGTVVHQEGHHRGCTRVVPGTTVVLSLLRLGVVGVSVCALVYPFVC